MYDQHRIYHHLCSHQLQCSEKTKYYMLVLITYHNAYFYYISNIKSHQSKTKYNKISINMYVCTNMTTKQSNQKIEV